MESPAGLTSMRPPGIVVFSIWRSTLRSRPTFTSREAICRPAASITKTEVEPLAMPSRKSLRVDRTTAFATPGLATKISFASWLSSTTTERPIDRSSRRAPLPATETSDTAEPPP